MTVPVQMMRETAQVQTHRMMVQTGQVQTQQMMQTVQAIQQTAQTAKMQIMQAQTTKMRGLFFEDCGYEKNIIFSKGL